MPPLGHRGRPSGPGRAAQPHTAPKPATGPHSAGARRLRAQSHSTMAEHPKKRQQSHARPGHGSHTLNTKAQQHSHAQPRYKSETPPQPGTRQPCPARHRTRTRETQPLQTHPAASRSGDTAPSHAHWSRYDETQHPQVPRHVRSLSPRTHRRTYGHTHTQGCPGDHSPRRAVGSREPRGAERGGL